MALFHFALRMGGFGLLALAVLDSSFLFLPLGNDLLMVAFTARQPHLFWYYALMTTVGSVIGTWIMDATSRKLGEAGLADRVPKRRLDFIKRQFEKRAGWTLVGSSLMTPPFPYTVVIIVFSALQYSRKRLLLLTGFGRLVRFTVLGLLAMVWGRQILRFFGNPAVKWVLTGLVVISVVGSLLSVWKWIRRSRTAKPAPQESVAPA